MDILQRYRTLYEHEKVTTDAFLTMIESVPTENRTDPQFARAVNLAAHLAACRENWLALMTGSRDEQVPWFEEDATLESLRPRFTAIEARWTEYLAGIDETELARYFTLPIEEGKFFRWTIEGQILQLFGHAPYHRGQIVLLVDALGGTTEDTDYADWAWKLDPHCGVVDSPE